MPSYGFIIFCTSLTVPFPFPFPFSNKGKNKNKEFSHSFWPFYLSQISRYCLIVIWHPGRLNPNSVPCSKSAHLRSCATCLVDHYISPVAVLLPPAISGSQNIKICAGEVRLCHWEDVQVGACVCVLPIDEEAHRMRADHGCKLQFVSGDASFVFISQTGRMQCMVEYKHSQEIDGSRGS